LRILFLHPEDPPQIGPWVRERWDLVVDLGFAGAQTYADWSRTLNGRILSIHQFAGETESYRWVNRVFQQGRRRLLDREGLDWWDLLAMESYQDLHSLYLFRQLQREIGPGVVELAATRPHRLTNMAGQVFGVPVRHFQQSSAGPIQKISRAFYSARKLRSSQIVEIVFDKWDPAYQLRRHLAKYRRARLLEPCVLVPSAYSNVTRSALAYASLLPGRNFLLVATRPNAIPVAAPRNVTVTSLAAYVRPRKTTHEEAIGLQRTWQALIGTLQDEDEEFRCAAAAGVWEYFPAHLEQGLRLRDAWLSALESEPVTGVLCGDDLNHHTRLPLMLAQRKGLNAVYCSHGALDGGFLFKTPSADTYLVKGEMEKDYLERAASIDPERIVVGAPGNRPAVSAESKTRDAIVFFSQPYEIAGGRADSMYEEIIPRLHSAARASGRKLIVKLHPFESTRVRRALINSALGSTACGEVEIIGGKPPDEVMSRAWCGITVDSSVAVECTLRGIPFFLCAWLDLTGLGYLEQFARFGAAMVLNAPEDIERIPQRVAEFRPDPASMQRLWHDADPAHLEDLMFGARQARTNPCVC
jgi:hypothetical protein